MEIYGTMFEKSWILIVEDSHLFNVRLTKAQSSVRESAQARESALFICIMKEKKLWLFER